MSAPVAAIWHHGMVNDIRTSSAEIPTVPNNIPVDNILYRSTSGHPNPPLAAAVYGGTFSTLPFLVGQDYTDWYVDLGAPYYLTGINYHVGIHSGDWPRHYQVYGNLDGSAVWNFIAERDNGSPNTIYSLALSGTYRYLWVHQTGIQNWTQLFPASVDTLI